MHSYVGVDGCKAGWTAVRLTPSGEWTISIFRCVSELWSAYSTARLILIDIPIGLKDGGPDGTVCDKQARQLLGYPRAASIFPPPIRPALQLETREEASALNHSLTGRKIGVQSWGIVPKIREVDRFLRGNPVAREKIREVHPELAFWALNGCRPMVNKKTLREGLEERLGVLRRFFPQSDAVVKEARHRFPRRQVARDDILDALVAAVTAQLGDDRLASLPKESERDSSGLPMEIVYLPVHSERSRGAELFRL